MADHDDLASRLEALGSAEAPSLSDERRSAIEARVLASAAGDIPGAPAGRRRWAMALASAAVLALLVVGAVVAMGGRGAATELDAVSGTVAVELPDGRTVDGVVGTDLPDGSVIDIAAGSSATVDGVVLPPGRYALVDGRPEPMSSTADTSTTTTSTTSVGRSTTTTTTPDGPDSGAPVAPTRTTTTFPARPTTTMADRPPVRPSTTLTVRPVDRPTTTTTSGPPATAARPTTTEPVTQRPTTTTTTPNDRSRDR